MKDKLNEIMNDELLDKEWKRIREGRMNE